ncbi:hypothetical protein A5791_01630 [Mycobacterium sp. 852002-51163_SCH5372311]|uniref:DUF4226 domain-containing protein n=1 Tax=Mycobacterium sp. 852002-51163_SCH5372311 TaxID=1834097 RepID=UPI0007FBE736|nr:DUF4226 domain-containing protein [Mycobacterium sp. 852002-51163_SCH5372311]OBF86171.1 hypothetical protein A5791_01630 [Mycobacterium sp. 852002-51163_SCH5372311]
MAEQAEPSIAAIQAKQAGLASRHNAITDADRFLTEAIGSAHAEMRESVRRLDAIAAEIERAVSDQSAVDTPLGAREFQRFLVAKEREIAAVVAHARELAQAKSAVLQELRDQYAAGAS